MDDDRKERGEKIREMMDMLHEEGIVLEDRKPLSYLGWWFKASPNEYERVSYYQGQFWADPKGKWDYPSTNIETDKLYDKMEELLAEALDDGRPPNQKAFQEFLDEEAGDFTVHDSIIGEDGDRIWAASETSRVIDVRSGDYETRKHICRACDEKFHSSKRFRTHARVEHSE